MARLDQVYRDGFAITPANTDLPRRCDGLLVTATGNVTIITEGGTTMTFSAVPAYSIIPFSVTQVTTATTATVVGCQFAKG